MMSAPSALPDTDALSSPLLSSDAVPGLIRGADAVAVRRRTRRTAEIVPFRQDEDVLRSFFADTVAPAPAYGIGGTTRATLVALAAVTAGGAFVAAASQLL